LWFILVSEHFQALSPGQLPEVDSVPGEQSFGTGCLTNSWTDIQKNRITVGGSSLLIFDFKMSEPRSNLKVAQDHLKKMTVMILVAGVIMLL